MTGVIEPQLDRKMKVTWSEAMSQFSGYDRLFAKVIKQAKAYEAEDVRIKADTEKFHQQRKRGTTNDDKHNRSNISMSVGNQRTQAQKSSNSNALQQKSQHNTQDTIDTHVRTV